MTEAERHVALEQIAAEVRVCTRCRLHEGRTRAVPGEGNPDTEVVFVGEGPGFNEDREGRPFVGRAGALLVRLLASVGWRREDVFITNVVKCRPPDNRDPQLDEIAACSPFLRRQLEALDPALVVTLGRYSMGTFMPGARISQAHGTMKPAPPETGARDALAFAMYHPAAALRATELERTSFADMATVPAALVKARERRDRRPADGGAAAGAVRADVVVATETAPTDEAELALPEIAGNRVGVEPAIDSSPRDLHAEAWTAAAPPAPRPAEPATSLATRHAEPASPPPPDVPADQLTLF